MKDQHFDLNILNSNSLKYFSVNLYDCKFKTGVFQGIEHAGVLA